MLTDMHIVYIATYICTQFFNYKFNYDLTAAPYLMLKSYDKLM